MINDIESKTKEQLLGDFNNTQSHATLISEKYNAAIIVKSAQSIENAIDKFNNTVDVLGKKSDELSKKIFWLNLILTIATAVGAIATVIMAIKKFFPVQ